MTLPSVSYVMVVRVDDLVFRLDNASRSLLIRGLLTILLIVLVSRLCSLLSIGLGLLLLAHLVAMGLHLLVDIALQLCLLLVHIDVVKQRVVTLDT